eukprot:10711458-Alexandrium_andersonii.AAC.1
MGTPVILVGLGVADDWHVHAKCERSTPCVGLGAFSDAALQAHAERALGATWRASVRARGA